MCLEVAVHPHAEKTRSRAPLATNAPEVQSSHAKPSFAAVSEPPPPVRELLLLPEAQPGAAGDDGGARHHSQREPHEICSVPRRKSSPRCRAFLALAGDVDLVISRSPSPTKIARRPPRTSPSTKEMVYTDDAGEWRIRSAQAALVHSSACWSSSWRVASGMGAAHRRRRAQGALAG